MNQTRFNRLAAGVFSTVCALQLVRLIRGWDAEVGGRSIPLWASGAAALASGSLAAWAIGLDRPRRRAPVIGSRAWPHRLVSSGSLGTGMGGRGR